DYYCCSYRSGGSLLF
nr:immunoglobulin light chain junction region [Macaca mulatta]MOV96308.1 immunoglobulin light chain junction region [Macaca mulatta]MOV96790.1 immunoglobulin light chain junction region [Macaca mulatta]MOV99337.1 immunoglobulin light chain junction region [Macaca mulatta]MOW00208.1 immunoglobulin light chain junction region [Macaca mulatta]